MSGLSSNASLEEVEDELIFQQTLLDSLGPEVAENDTQRSTLLKEIAKLESRLDALTGCTPNGDGRSDGDDDSASTSGQISSSTSASKRSGDTLADGSRSKRPAYNSRDSTASIESIPAPTQSNNAYTIRYLERQVTRTSW